MRVIEPITITESMIGTITNEVPEADYPGWPPTASIKGTRAMIGRGSEVFTTPEFLYSLSCVAMAATPNDDIYLAYGASASGGIFRRTHNTDYWEWLFDSATTAAMTGLSGICAAPNGDIYYCTNGSYSGITGEIYIMASGATSFTALSVGGDRSWASICAAPNGDIYACVQSGDIYKRTGGTGSFAAMSTTSRVWSGMCVSPSGVVYACVYGGDIYYLSGGSFVALSAGTKNWNGMFSIPYGDIFAVVGNEHEIYKRSQGTGSFAATHNATVTWYDETGLFEFTGGCADSTGKVYACHDMAGVYSWVPSVHHNYEVINPTGYSPTTLPYPPYSITEESPAWMDLGATNKWKCFDGKTTTQTTKASPMVYKITPGISVNSVALLNLSATSVTVTATTGGYSTTITTGQSDIVLTDLPGGTSDVITITITNSGGTSAVGEIILGNYYTLGTFKRDPTVGITDYSKKSADVYGDYTIVQRSYSKKMTCAVMIANASVDTVFNWLAEHRSTPLVWIGSTSYTSTILFGFYKDFSIVLSTPNGIVASIEIEGLT